MLNFDEIEAWIADDPDTATQAEIRDLVTAAQVGDEVASADLADRFNGTLTFGTAGLRGQLGGGPNRMNRAVVIRAAAGLVAYLKETVGPDFHLVVGHDARYGSKQFAQDTAAIAVAAGGRASLFDRALPTPVTAFALRHLNADAAVVVTASHNPPQDNGYKVYLGGRAVTDSGQGAQIVPPADKDIFTAIKAVPSVASVEMAESGWETLSDEIVEAYLSRVTSLIPAGEKNLRIVLTSMHGVGGETCLAALNRAGFNDVHLVAEQHDPNPDFPTVTFPNPEEPGALDLSFALAQKVDADIILANDPDADRCSAAIRDPKSANGWRQLSGDEVGSLLGEQAASKYAGDSAALLANSIVSSQLLEQIAKHHGVSYKATLTGFKWISRVDGLVFGYEEALGYCVDPGFVRDKDGISACLQLATMAADRKADGSNLQDALDDLARRHGLYATAPLSIRVSDLSLIQQGMANLRKGELTELAGSPLASVVDLSEGSAELPPTDGLIFRTERGDRVVARPSGTEPKLKCYLETIVEVPEGACMCGIREEATKRLEQMKLDMRAALGI
ncbi:phosphoglucomutase/phosphomannomutase, alpha/beta/alpha domain II [Gleimia coleocanis DSM 15436]|uniref:Phosphoglucomutase/phosphomannomutase, alpha/beta/alpha domain II n=1 Tax=Gleimia coleocanis DSM 15436 TaxID=525245 RepID=C0W109_9ACTO|nr:phospho-sugar mutase [Gleimia coleocanis]EEH63733.1 phosphoglucomutase/phosphomannomutase, alpha/beta/alpha domain II [Gleimia coleocanis DSM 15436]